MSTAMNDLKGSGAPHHGSCWPFNNIVNQLYQFLQSLASEPLKQMDPGDMMMSQWHLLMNVCLNKAFLDELRHELHGRENRPTAACVRDLVARERNFLWYCRQDRRMMFTVLMALALLIDEEELGLESNRFWNKLDFFQPLMHIVREYFQRPIWSAGLIELSDELKITPEQLSRVVKLAISTWDASISCVMKSPRGAG